MNNKINLSVDSGKSHTKMAWYANNDPKGNIMSDSFPTMVDEVTQLNGFLNGGTLVEDKGKLYEVGGTSEPSLEFDNTKLSELHERCIFTAIAKMLIKLNVQLHQTQYIHLAINVPLHDYMTIQNEYINQYKSRHVKLRISDKQVSFIISKVMLSPEGVGVIVRNTTSTVGSYYVIDIGGKNDTHLLFENFRPTKGKNSMTNNGVLRFLQRIASELSSQYDFTIKDIEDIALGKKQKPPLFEEVFEKHAQEWAMRIKNQAQKFSLNPHFVKIIISGGGGMLLKKQLEVVFKEFNLIFASDARFDNAKGALMRMRSNEENQ